MLVRNGDRVKLRGKYSQGIAVPRDYRADQSFHEPISIPVHEFQFDIENGEKEDPFDPNDWVEVTEKLHGTFVIFGIYNDGAVHKFVSSKELASKGLALKLSNERNLYVQVTEPYFAIFNELPKEGGLYCAMGVIYGQGVQDLTYGVSPRLNLFSMYKSDYGWIPRSLMFNLVYQAMPTLDTKNHIVPLLWSGLYKNLPLKKVRDGSSVLDRNTIRKGVVVQFGHAKERKIAKFISPKYLTRKAEPNIIDF